MKVQLREKDAKLYSKLYVSKNDIAFARYCAGVLLEHGWHAEPWEMRETMYQQQAAFTTALVTAYARPFTHSKGWPDFPSKLIDTYDQREKALHQKIMKLRHKVYAHSDSESYSIHPSRGENCTITTVIEPTMRITAEDAKLFEAMSSKLLSSIHVRMEAIPGVGTLASGKINEVSM